MEACTAHKVRPWRLLLAGAVEGLAEQQACRAMFQAATGHAGHVAHGHPLVKAGLLRRLCCAPPRDRERLHLQQVHVANLQRRIDTCTQIVAIMRQYQP